MFLLDVNVLIALLDPQHVHHQKVTEWFLKNSRDGWSTCPLSENGFIRIFGHTNYPEGPGDTLVARSLLYRLSLQPGYQFWSDSISLCEHNQYLHLPGSKHLTDYYLLALSIKHQGELVTLDQRIDPSLLKGGLAAYHII